MRNVIVVVGVMLALVGCAAETKHEGPCPRVLDCETYWFEVDYALEMLPEEEHDAVLRCATEVYSEQCECPDCR